MTFLNAVFLSIIDRNHCKFDKKKGKNKNNFDPEKFIDVAAVDFHVNIKKKN